MDARQRDAWISPQRFARYLAAAGGDPELGYRLYAWHAQVSAASFLVMHHFEVLLRNAVDHRLGAGQPESPLRDTWLLDFDVLKPGAIKQVITAVERLEKGRTIGRARVVAGLSFGFWQGLFGGGYEELWRRELRHALPGAGQRKELSVPLERLRVFRNRLAHHDSILEQPVFERYEDMLRIARHVDPEAEVWLAGVSLLPALLDGRPA